MRYLTPNSRRRPHSRRGLTLTEILVSGTLLVTALATVLPVTVRNQRLQTQALHYRVALDELSNQLDRLTTLSPTDVPAALDTLTLSKQIDGRLPAAELGGEFLQDEHGPRILLRLRWRIPGDVWQPLQLVGWLDLPVPPDAAGDDNPSPQASPQEPAP
jgi:hypothetical protein